MRVEPIYNEEEFDKVEQVARDEEIASIQQDTGARLSRIKNDWENGTVLLFSAWESLHISDDRSYCGAGVLRKSRSRLETTDVHIDLLFTTNTEEHSLRSTLSDLIEYATTTCAKYGYPEIDLLIDGTGNSDTLLNFLYSLVVLKDFGVKSENRRGHNKEFILSKNLEPLYPGDRYDIQHVAEWLFQQWGARYIEDTSNSFRAEHKIDNLLSLSVDISLCTACSDEGESFVDINIHIDHDGTSENGFNVPISQIRRRTGKRVVLPDEPYKATVVLIRPRRMRQFSTNGPNIYVDGGQYGCLLNAYCEDASRIVEDTSNDSDECIIFANSTDEGDDILGIGVISSLVNLTPAEATNLLDNKLDIMSFRSIIELKQYINVKTTLTAFRFYIDEAAKTGATFSDIESRKKILSDIRNYPDSESFSDDETPPTNQGFRYVTSDAFLDFADGFEYYSHLIE